MRCPPPCGSGMPYAVPDQAFLTRDGYLAISARTQAEWARLCSAIGREDLVDDPCQADLNADGSVSTADLLQFLTSFGEECN